MKPPPATLFTSVALIGASSNSKSSRSLASGSWVMVSWYLIERACHLGDLGLKQIADDALELVLGWGSCWRLTAVAMTSSKAVFVPYV
jgi:hypothetical protein